MRSRQEQVMLGLAFSLAFTLHLLIFATAPMFEDITLGLGITFAEFGLVFSTTRIGGLLLRFPWGVAGDRYGYLRVLRISLPLVVLFAFLRSFAQDYAVLLLIQVFLGFALASIIPLLPCLVREWSPTYTGMATGIYIAGLGLGTATALGLTPFLLEIMDWRAALLAYGFIALAVMIAWFLFARSSDQVRPGVRIGDVRRFLTNRWIWLLVLLLVVSMGAFDTLSNWMSTVLSFKSMDLSLALLLPLGFLASGPIVGLLADRVEREAVLIAALGMGAFITILAATYSSGVFLAACIFLIGFFLTGITTIVLRAPARHPSLSTSAGKVTGIISSLGNIGPVILPITFGAFVDLSGTYIVSMFLIASITLLGCAICSWLWRSRQA